MIFYDKTKKRKEYFAAAVATGIAFGALTLTLAFSALFRTHIGGGMSVEQITANYDSLNGKKVVALTFDDGPDPMYTPQILAILEEKKVPATFFMIGEEVANHPEIAREVSNAGFEIGNHTYTHSEAVHNSKDRLTIELTATNKAIQSATGYAPVLYRPPFLDETGMTISGKRNDQQAEPELTTARSFGYIVAGADIDSRDWDADSPEEILGTIHGNMAPNHHVILMHDGGSDRSKTVEALPELIDSLKADGYTFVPFSSTIGLAPTSVMQGTAANDSMGDAALFVVLRTILLVQAAVGIIAILILVVTVFRIQAMLLLRFGVLEGSVKRNARRRGRSSVAVIIPAYNEELNISATALSVLSNTYKPTEVIVIDDGSKDATSEKVAALALHHPEIHLIRVTNGGKARALNIGIAYAKSDVVICIDGDTMFHPEAIGKLVRHFDDPTVGVVAGKVMPVWGDTLLNKFQTTEYIIGQNIDKEVFAGLEAIGVVPGAVGAWRKSAIREGNGYPEDTIVEDQDLTLSFLESGYRVEYDGEAIAYTEAPSSVGDFMKQRFRWVFGTFQCFWKYRRSFFSMKKPGLGFIVLPNILLFNCLLPLLTPFIDIAIIWSLVTGQFGLIVESFIAFTILDLLYALLALWNERQLYPRLIIPIILQRFFYRYVMFYVVAKSLITAIRGTIAPKSKWIPPTRMGHAQAAFDNGNKDLQTSLVRVAS